VSRRARAIPLLILAAAAAAAAACSETGTDPEAVVSISFDSLPAPSVVEGDTLRDDSTGAVAPLAPFAFNGKGDTIENAPFRFFVRDTGGALEIDSVSGIVVARKPRATAANFVASFGNLQLPQSLLIVPRPDSLAASDSALSTLQLVTEVPTDLLRNLTPPCSVRVLHDSTDAGTRVAVPVRAWVVFYQIDSAATSVADSVRLVNDAGARQAKDTTNESGYAALRVRVFAKPAPASGTTAITDSVIVRAYARYRGTNLRGSPHRFAIPVRLGQAPSP